ncbi:MAG: glucuronate isomerase, partial [Chloroflexota bacterium]
DHRVIWRTFAQHFYLFRGTPTGIWLTHELEDVFGVTEKLNADSADRIYNQINECLGSPEYAPRKLYERFNIEVLCTTDAATGTLEHHRKIRASAWNARILPTFRPDDVLKIDRPSWHANLGKLAELTDTTIHNYQNFLDALKIRREQFKALGATATDHDRLDLQGQLEGGPSTAEIFENALKDPKGLPPPLRHQFELHVLHEMANMSSDDGLVMQLHIGSHRNHNQQLIERFGPDKGADIPHRVDFTRDLGRFINAIANPNDITIVLFTLDESTYARELAPLAGHYPALKLGPPWWFHDSLNGMHRYFDRVTETAGIYNLAGFNDDTRAFPS